jgi:flagellar biosynthesis protein FlhG
MKGNLPGKSMARTITVTSGKGGVGKTNISVNLALQLAASGYRVCLFDADLGPANINMLLNLHPEYNLEDVIQKQRHLQDIIIRNFKGIDIIPGSSGVEQMADLDKSQVDRLTQEFMTLDEYDFLIFDTSAGISKNVIAFCLAVTEILLIITPEPVSQTDGYSLLKILSLNGYGGAIKIIVSQCKDIPSAKLAFSKFRETVEQYLKRDVTPLGSVLQDEKFLQAMKAQQALVDLYPDCTAAKCIGHLARNLIEQQSREAESCVLDLFWKKFFEIFRGPLKGIQEPYEKDLSERAERSESPDEKEAQKFKGNGNDQDTNATEPPPETNHADRREPEGESDLARSLNLLISGLLKSTSAISRELQLIRMVIEEQGKNDHSASQVMSTSVGGPASRPIILDFEAFVQRRAKEKSHG